MKLIFGLWNPWDKYKNTRHNIWFMFLDWLKDDIWTMWDFKSEKKFNAEILKTTIDDEEIILIKPLTFMNLSWESVLSTMSFYKIKKEDILVIYDDISMEFGKVRYRHKWSAGGQNGIKNIISKIWDEFQRIKIWVWENEYSDLTAWVLSKFNDAEISNLESQVFSNARDVLIKEFIRW